MTILAAGQLIADRYELVSRIAVGGMGEVWEAADTRLGRSVAVKILRPELSGDDEFRHRFRIEARTVASLDHPGIAHVHDYGEDVEEGRRTAYLVMELVRGEPLSTIVARGPVQAGETLRIVEQAAWALHAAHERGFVHRDVKPGNILVADDGRVKLTDFGIAKAANAAPVTRSGMVMGTAHYIAPEQATGGEAGPTGDVYSLGIVAYECLAGQRPFRGENAVDVAAMQVRDAPPPLPATVPANIRGLIDAVLVKDPTQRYSTGREFAEAVAAVRRGESAPPPAGLADPSGPAEPSGPDDTSARRRRRWTKAFPDLPTGDRRSTDSRRRPGRRSDETPESPAGGGAVTGRAGETAGSETGPAGGAAAVAEASPGPSTPPPAVPLPAPTSSPHPAGPLAEPRRLGDVPGSPSPRAQWFGSQSSGSQSSGSQSSGSSPAARRPEDSPSGGHPSRPPIDSPSGGHPNRPPIDSPSGGHPSRPPIDSPSGAYAPPPRANPDAPWTAMPRPYLEPAAHAEPRASRTPPPAPAVPGQPARDQPAARTSPERARGEVRTPPGGPRTPGRPAHSAPLNVTHRSGSGRTFLLALFVLLTLAAVLVGYLVLVRGVGDTGGVLGQTADTPAIDRDVVAWTGSVAGRKGDPTGWTARGAPLVAGTAEGGVR